MDDGENARRNIGAVTMKVVDQDYVAAVKLAIEMHKSGKTIAWIRNRLKASLRYGKTNSLPASFIPEQFAAFARLRDLRKVMAQAEAVPVYTIFTNEQLAQIVQARATSKSALEQVVGVGDGRVGKYGERILEWLRQQWGGKESDAASKPAF